MVLLQTSLPNLYAKGKVRDTYHLDEGHLLMVATDRISAFDVVLPTGVPDKGRVLTQLSAFWFERTRHIVPNHLVELVTDAALLQDYCLDGICYLYPPEVVGRSMIVRQAQPLPVECVVRGYLAGSAWAEYRKSGSLWNISVPPGLQESQRLPTPLFTPTTKAQTGHDEYLAYRQVEAQVGAEVAAQLRQKSLELYQYARAYAQEQGLIIADTKFEFGWVEGTLTLIDELLTPDSSRFWPAEGYAPGRPQPSFDKQYVRDWLLSAGWNREPPAPELPPSVVQGTRDRYREAYQRLVGQALL